MYGLPKFGRQLPPDLTIISFEMLKVVEETNLEITEDFQKKVTSKEIETEDIDINDKREIVSPIVKPKVQNKIVCDTKTNCVCKVSAPTSQNKNVAALCAHCSRGFF